MATNRHVFIHISIPTKVLEVKNNTFASCTCHEQLQIVPSAFSILYFKIDFISFHWDDTILSIQLNFT